MHRPGTRRRAAVLAALLVVGGLAGCGSGDDDDAGADPGPESTAPGPGPDAADSPAEGEAGDGTEITALTGTEICEGLPGAVLGPILGLDVTAAEADDDGTPQCRYAYDAGSGGASDVTVASLRGDEDLGGRTAGEAFAHVVELNETAAGEYEAMGVAAGERAVLLAGSALLFGVVLTGDHLFTVIVPTGDADRLQVQALMARVVTELA